MEIKLVSIVSIIFLLLSSFYLHKGAERPIKEVFEELKTQDARFNDLQSAEQEYRLKIFLGNVLAINQHNSNLNRTYEKGINKFTVYTQSEFEEFFLEKIDQTYKYVIQREPIVKKLTVNTDWVSRGAVTSVKDQGACKGSYAFSAIGGIEGISAIFYKRPVEYSAQHLIDCTNNYGNNGCESGSFINSYNFATAKGVNTLAAYPYSGKTQSCHAQAQVFKISGSYNVSTCITLVSALGARPISVLVDGQNFASYKSGIFSDCGTNLSLSVLLVANTDDIYFTIKNSWGTGWGEAGYMRVRMGNNICGLCSAASFPLP